MSKLAVAFAVAASLFSSIPALSAQQATASPPAAPVPVQIRAAKKVFVSNGGGDVNLNLDNRFVYGASPADSYNRFYEAVKNWGRYQVIDTPAEADLVFEIRLSVAISPGETTRGNSWNSADPQLRLCILDPKTGVILWAFTEHVPTALLQGNRNKNLYAAVEKLVDDVKELVLPKR